MNQSNRPFVAIATLKCPTNTPDTPVHRKETPKLRLRTWRKTTIPQSLPTSALTPCAAVASKSFRHFPTTPEPTRRRKVPLLAGIPLSPPDLPSQVPPKVPDL